MKNNMPEELLPLIDWWEQNGKQTVVLALVAAIAVGGWYGVKNYRADRRAAAATVLLDNFATAEELEDAVAKYESSAAGPSLRLRLAKKYFNDERYQEALDLYTELDGQAPAGFEDVPAVGVAQCLEALEKYDEAVTAYDAFAAAKPTSYLALTARLGAARAIAARGDKVTARKRLEELTAEVKSDATATARVEATMDLVTRWEKRATRSLFDAAEAATKQLEADASKPAVPETK